MLSMISEQDSVAFKVLSAVLTAVVASVVELFSE